MGRQGLENRPLDGGGRIPFYPQGGEGGLRGREGITAWEANKRVCSGHYSHTDYDFTNPRAMLLSQAPLLRNHSHDRYEVFDYPGIYERASQGEEYARTRIEELQAGHELLRGEGDARALAVGGLFTLGEHPRGDQNREYLITQASYTLNGDAYGSVPGSGESPVYHCEFGCLDSRESFRAARSTVKPVVKGPQTAVVVGRAGEEIHIDEYGRVKVQFHWDRYGQSDENSSCWVRVSQVWAGQYWGGMQIPRIGQEVIVDFLEGGPDRPIITGRVYNAVQKPPWELPANQTQSGILSRSTKGGTAANANAIRFEDKKGEEQLWLHAEKDQLTEVEHDEDKWVGNDRRKTIDGNETTTVHKNRTETVDLNETITIGANRTEEVVGNESIGIGGNRIVTISGNKAETVIQAKAETITLGKALSIGGAYQTTVAGAMNTSVGLMRAEEVGKSKQDLVGQRYHIRVGDEHEIKSGKSAIVMKSDGSIVISGDGIELEASGQISINGKRVDFEGVGIALTKVLSSLDEPNTLKGTGNSVGDLSGISGAKVQDIVSNIPASPHYDIAAANNTHIPIQTPEAWLMNLMKITSGGG